MKHIVENPLQPIVRTVSQHYGQDPVSTDEILRRQAGGTITIFLDERPHETNAITMSGAEIKALRGSACFYRLTLADGSYGGKELCDHEAIYVHEGMHFSLTPPAL